MSVVRLTNLLLLAAIAASAAPVRAAFIVEADNVAPAGKANDHFSAAVAGGFSLSTGLSSAVGLAGNQSAFGNPADATGPDAYTFRYTPGVDSDNTVLAALTPLGNSAAVDPDGAGALPPVYAVGPQLASGQAGGGSGLYNVYFTSPSSTNVDVAGSIIRITSDLPDVVLNPVNLNDTNTGPDEAAGTPFTGGANNRWLKIATVPLTAGTTYTVVITANSPTFVSQRAHGVMWELAVPEPASCGMAGLAALGLLAVRRRD
jgi:hypothetical protein